ncbi:MFS transporter [Streptosporangium subroseum]|uniref:MFS transporter n=1 Tax=Streptosporangium subroseum TaxID=106412 RepID=UPI003087B6E3|nr:MFS transporter [Streptosporangium subroseum]
MAITRKTTGTEPGERARRQALAGLAVLGLPTFLVALDLSVLYLALPHLGADLGADSVQQLWITDVYGFMLAGLLVTMGTLGDRIGRKRLLLIGAGAFAAASALAAYATSPEMLIASRALLGVAGSTIMPSTMALISVMFTDRRRHSMAIAVWMGCFMGGAALGPVVGGVLLEFFWWGSVFLLAVPVMGVLLVLAPKLLPESRNAAAGRLDLPSAALLLATILPVVFGLKQLARDGAGPVQILAILAGTACGVLFLRRQRRLSDPMLDLGLFRDRTFSAALALTMFAGLTGANQLFVSLYMQSVEELSPVATALWLIPSAVAMVVIMQVVPILTRRIRPAYVIAGGLAVAAIGFLMLTRLDGDGNLPLLVTGLVVANLGIGPMGGLCAALAMQSAPPEKAGLAASTTSTAGELGIALGVVTVGVAGTAVYRGQMTVSPDIPAAAADTARDSIAGALSVAGRLPAQDAATLLDDAYRAVTAALHGSAVICAALVLVAAAITLAAMRHVPPSGSGEPPAEDASTAPEPARP